MRKRDARLALLGATALVCAAACNLVVNVPVEGAPDDDGGPGLEDGSSEAGGDALGSDAATTTAPEADAGTRLPPTTILAVGGTPPVSLAVDGTNVFWTESNGGVFKVARDGGPVTTVKEPDDAGTSAGRIATDGINVYWADAAHHAIQYVSRPASRPTAPTCTGRISTTARSGGSPSSTRGRPRT
jgi:hypothetical protein